MNRRLVCGWICLALLSAPAFTKERKPKPRTLESYLSRVQSLPTLPNAEAPRGSLWTNSGQLADLSSDYKARAVGDPVIIQIAEQTLAESSASVASQRKLAAESGISALAGQVNTAGIEELFSPHSNQTLQGQGQTASKSRLRTAIAGRVVALLPGGAMVVEAERNVQMNNERQNVILRGVARAADVTPENSIMSTQLSNLEIEVSGKGIVSDSTRPPTIIVRWLFRLLGF